MPHRTTKRAALIILTLTSILTPFMVSTINISLPSIQREFQVNAILLKIDKNSLFDGETRGERVIVCQEKRIRYFEGLGYPVVRETVKDARTWEVGLRSE